MHNRFIYDTNVSSERMGCRKISSLGKGDHSKQEWQWFVPPTSKLCPCKRAHLPTFQFIQLLLLEEVLFSYQLAIENELCFSILVSQFYLNSMKYPSRNLQFFFKEEVQYKNSDAVVIFRIYLYLAFYCLKWLHRYYNYETD